MVIAILKILDNTVMFLKAGGVERYDISPMILS
jgi:hypothetical protein